MNAEKIKTLLSSVKNIFKKDFIVGLDIGSSSVKIAQFTKKEDGLHLVKADLREIASSPSAPRNDGEEKNISTLKELFRGVNVKKSKIIAIINCPKTATKIAKAPYMPKTELKKGISLEAKSYFPFPIEGSELDYEILGDAVEKGVRKYEIAVSVSPKVTVEKNLSLLRKAGIKPVSFVPCPYTLQKLAEKSYSKEGKTTCIIDIGELHTELAIFKGKALVFTRKIPVTGKSFTSAMTGALVSETGKIQLSPEEAEKIKRETGIPPAEGESKIIDGKISTTQVLAMMRPLLEQLADEIGRCFDYHREESGGEKTDSVVLFGGGAALSGLTKFLSEELGIEVKLGDPLEGLKVEPKAVPERDKISYRLGPAVGAALTDGKGINLLPPEIKEETKRIAKRGTLEVIVTAVVLVSLLLYIGMRIQLGNFKKRISVAKKELSSLQHQYKKAEAHHLAGMVLIDEPHWEDILKELSHLIPHEIHLTDMRMEDNIITIEGIASSERGEQILSTFILALEKGIFKNVKLVSVKDLKDQVGNEFVVKCWVD